MQPLIQPLTEAKVVLLKLLKLWLFLSRSVKTLVNKTLFSCRKTK